MLVDYLNTSKPQNCVFLPTYIAFKFFHWYNEMVVIWCVIYLMSWQHALVFPFFPCQKLNVGVQGSKSCSLVIGLMTSEVLGLSHSPFQTEFISSSSWNKISSILSKKVSCFCEKVFLRIKVFIYCAFFFKLLSLICVLKIVIYATAKRLWIAPASIVSACNHL